MFAAAAEGDADTVGAALEDGELRILFGAAGHARPARQGDRA